MKITIISIESTIFNDDAIICQLPGIDGSFEILNNHANMIALLKKGKIKIVDINKAEHFFNINEGSCRMLNNNLTILIS